MNARLLNSLVLLAAPAVGQTCYVDFGPTGSAPSAGYHAAYSQVMKDAGASSHWNLVDVPITTIPLLDADGRTTCATLEFDNTQTGFDHGMQCPSGWGPDEFALYDGFRVIESAVVTFHDLVPGDYKIYTYGKTQLVQRTEVKVGTNVKEITNLCLPSTNWWEPGTYVTHDVTVQAGVPVVVELKYAGGGGQGAWGKLSAMQIVRSNDEQAGTNYCVTTPNSTGNSSTIAARATLDAPGVVSVLANNLLLTADNVPAGQPGLFFYGPNQAQVPFGNGILCVVAGSGAVARLAPTTACSSGILYHEVDMTNPPSGQTMILSGSTWHLQAWYRDPAHGGAAFNLSDALTITFGT